MNSRFADFLMQSPHTPGHAMQELKSFPGWMEFAAHPMILDMVEQIMGPDIILRGCGAGHIANRHTIDVIDRLPLLVSVRAARMFLVDCMVALATFMLLGGALGMIASVGGVSVTLHVDARVRYLTIPLACMLSVVIIPLNRPFAKRKAMHCARRQRRSTWGSPTTRKTSSASCPT